MNPLSALGAISVTALILGVFLIWTALRTPDARRCQRTARQTAERRERCVELIAARAARRLTDDRIHATLQEWRRDHA